MRVSETVKLRVVERGQGVRGGERERGAKGKRVRGGEGEGEGG